jgi:signal-transduction protein with cAMP-binding, CBS, and nucleotidyltransferase domain
MELDVKFLITLGGLAASIIGASAVAKYQLKNILEEIRSLWSFVKKLDQRLDKKDVDTEMLSQKMSVIGSMMTPDVLERRHRETEALKKDVEFIKEKLK